MVIWLAARAHAGVQMSDCVIWAFIAGLIIDREHLESRMQSEKLNSFLLSSISFHLNWILKGRHSGPFYCHWCLGSNEFFKAFHHWNHPSNVSVLHKHEGGLEKLIGGIYNTSQNSLQLLLKMVEPRWLSHLSHMSLPTLARLPWEGFASQSFPLSTSGLISCCST